MVTLFCLSSLVEAAIFSTVIVGFPLSFIIWGEAQGTYFIFSFAIGKLLSSLLCGKIFGVFNNL
jgi:hypothetical protein